MSASTTSKFSDKNVIPGDLSHACGHLAYEMRAPLHLSKTPFGADTRGTIVPSVDHRSCQRQGDAVMTTSLSTGEEEDVYHGGIVSDDSWSECSELTRDDEEDGLSVSSLSEMDESMCAALQASIEENGEECCMMDVADDVFFEPLDYRVPPKLDANIIQSDGDWELMRPTLLKILYSR